MVNKNLNALLGLDASALYSELCGRYDWFLNNKNVSEFFVNEAELMHSLGIKQRRLTSAMEMLINAGLMTRTKKGVPSKWHYVMFPLNVIKNNEQCSNEQDVLFKVTMNNVQSNNTSCSFEQHINYTNLEQVNYTENYNKGLESGPNDIAQVLDPTVTPVKAIEEISFASEAQFNLDDIVNLEHQEKAKPTQKITSQEAKVEATEEPAKDNYSSLEKPSVKHYRNKEDASCFKARMKLIDRKTRKTETSIRILPISGNATISSIHNALHLDTASNPSWNKHEILRSSDRLVNEMDVELTDGTWKRV